MHELYELKEMLCKELEEYGSKGELSAGSLDVVDKLAHAAKNVGKIIEMCEEEEYSMDGGSYERSMTGGSYARSNRGANQYGSYARGRSYARGANQYGSYARGYSRATEDAMSQLRNLMEETPDEHMRMKIERIMNKMDQM